MSNPAEEPNKRIVNGIDKTLDAGLVLEGVHAKIKMADEQIHELCEEIRVFEESQQKCVEHIAYEDRQEFVFVGDAKCPIEWSVRVGDIVHKLRSALDHLVTYLVLSNGNSTDSLSQKHQFPIFRSKEKYHENVEEYLKGVDISARAKICALQPFSAPKDNLSLWSLHCLNIIDKHRYIRIMNAYAFGPPGISLSNGFSLENDLWHFLSNWDRTSRGLEYLQKGLCLFRYRSLDPAFCKENLSLQVTVLFDDAVLAQEDPFVSFEKKPLSQTYSDIADKGPRGSVRLVLEGLHKCVLTSVQDLTRTK